MTTRCPIPRGCAAWILAATTSLLALPALAQSTAPSAGGSAAPRGAAPSARPPRPPVRLPDPVPPVPSPAVQASPAPATDPSAAPAQVPTATSSPSAPAPAPPPVAVSPTDPTTRDATSSPPPAAAGQGSVQPAPTDAATAGSTYAVKLHDLERRVNELKEQVFRSKARLNIMKETVLQGRFGGSRTVVVQRNEMSSSYKLIQLAYALDGAEIFAKADDTGHLADSKELEIFNGSLTPGKHTITARMVFQGNGYGVFAYLKGYKATVEKTCIFNADEGKRTQLKVVALEQGNPVTTDWDKRPSADCRITVSSDQPVKTETSEKKESTAAPPAPQPPAPAGKKK